MSRKVKHLSAKITLDLLALFAMSAAYLIGKVLSALFNHRDGLI